ncbi:glutaminyl-peptide cyclotransferase [Clostridium bowmanii]|uniref:glutaminyl-peptide cyclotransferase n=1 Tax=Clostridium bowmanii TaxID=132925 RepID=UPI001C0AD3CF|nr:glutaminyl-peptide cyclotransferase [Clostridium bowmanii]MBU3191769.1 glutaminyl-peptide cyclotransferase [Clostridium bowmanii]MCA1075942.1 glutaminyl-peptide cyclotransferase [Clostridium bowmanii]
MVYFNNIPVYSYDIINTYPHDITAFTEGLVYESGYMYESTGKFNESTLRKVDLQTGEIIKLQKLDESYFGEGITIYKNKIIQLTWKSNVGLIYNKDSFNLINKFYYNTEGWGITHNDEHLIMSDGTDEIFFLNPINFKKVYSIKVHDEIKPITRLNELEFIRGEIYANVCKSNKIARICPHSGKITGWIDLKGLLSPKEYKNVGTLNGITYNTKNNHIFVTGKIWPKIFEIKLV